MTGTARSVAKWKGDIRQFTDEVKAMIETEAKKSADQLAAKIKRVAPKLTGNLENSVKVEQITNGWLVALGGASTTRKVGTRTYVMKSGRARSGKPTDYAMVQEFGDRERNIPAQPYFNPARSKARKAHNRRVKYRLNKIAKTASAK